MNVRGKSMVFTWTGAALIGFASLATPTQVLAKGVSNGVPFQALQDQIDELRARLDGLNGNTHGSVVAVTVDCHAGETIGDAIDAARPGGVIEITVKGDCNESVVITRSHVVLKGDPGGGTVNALNVNDTAIFVPGASAVTIKDLTVNAVRDGIWASENAQVTVDNVNVHSTGNPANGFAIAVADGAFLRVSNSTLTSTATDAVGGGAVGAFRSGVLRMGGGNTVTSTEGGRAVHLAHSANLRQDAPNSYFGPIALFNVSFADFRGATLDSEVSANGGSWLRFRNTQVSGSVELNTDSGAFFDNGVSVTGQISCDGTIFGVPPQVDSAASDCQ